MPEQDEPILSKRMADLLLVVFLIIFLIAIAYASFNIEAIKNDPCGYCQAKTGAECQYPLIDSMGNKVGLVDYYTVLNQGKEVEEK